MVFKISAAVPLLAAFLVLGVACSTESRAWSQAQREDSVATYEAFLQAFPESEHAAAARTRIDDLRFERVKSRNTPFAYRKFGAQYPNSRHAKEADQRAREFDVAAAMKADTAPALLALIGLYPSGPHVGQVRSRLEQLFPPLSKEEATPLAGVADEVHPGVVLVGPGKKDGTCLLSGGARIVTQKGRSCGLFCGERIELAPETQLPIVWLRGEVTPCSELSATEDFSVALDRPCKWGADGVTADEARAGFIVAGPKGALLEKQGAGLKVLKGEANFFKPKQAGAKQDPDPLSGRVRTGQITCRLESGRDQIRKPGAAWLGSTGGWE